EKCNVTCNDEVTQGNATDIELDKDIDKEYIPFSDIIDYLNEQADKNFKHTTKATQQRIKARWNEGFQLNDFKRVIDAKVKDWKNNPDMSRYLRPETLFGTKFEGYLNELPATKKQEETEVPVDKRIEEIKGMLEL